MPRFSVAFAPIVAALLAACTLSTQVAPANGEACAVYREFYATLPEREAVFFRPLATPFARATWAEGAPTLFERDTGRSETVQIELTGESFERAVREEFSLDTTDYFDALRTGPPTNIALCFSDDGPPFSDWPFDLLFLRENLLNRDDDNFVTIMNVSPVGMSADGRHAVMYADYYCNALCGGGSFYLFEKQGERWVVIGDRWVWVS